MILRRGDFECSDQGKIESQRWIYREGTSTGTRTYPS